MRSCSHFNLDQSSVSKTLLLGQRVYGWCTSGGKVPLAACGRREREAEGGGFSSVQFSSVQLRGKWSSMEETRK
jgi:hypothetical protein